MTPSYATDFPEYSTVIPPGFTTKSAGQPKFVYVVVGADLPVAAFLKQQDAERYVVKRKSEFQKHVSDGFQPFPVYWRTIELELK